MKKVLTLLALIISLVSFQKLKAQTVWTVTNTGSLTTAGTPADNNVAARTGSLAFCIANMSAAGPNVINFSVAGTISQTGFQSLKISAKSNLTIDGTTAPGYSCAGGPTVKLLCDGSGGGGGGWLLTGSTNIIVKGLAVIGYIRITNGVSNQVLGCHVNMEFGGTAAAASVLVGSSIRIDGGSSTNNIIGGLNDCDRNILNAGTGSSNSRGVYVVGVGTGNQVLGNYIGTDITGLIALGNYFTIRLIEVDGGNFTKVQGNVMSNGLNGIWLDGTATDCTVKDNMVGADKNGLFQTAFAIGSNGIRLWGTNSRTIIQGNVSGNFTTTSGGYPNGANVIVASTCSDVQILDNYVGVDKNFTKGGSPWCGIFSRGTPITISGNFIGDNGILNTAQYSHGIGTESVSNSIISNNYVGVTPTGGDVGNGDQGIEINGGSNVTISGNVIGFNKSLRAVGNGGIGLTNGASTITIDNNYIGVTPANLPAGNLTSGITVDISNVTISNNRIANNLLHGIYLFSGDNIYATNNCMWCNGTGVNAGTGRGIVLNGFNNNYAESYTVPSGTYPEVKINTIGVGATNTDTTGANWIIRGYAPAGAVGASIEVFVMDDCHFCTEAAPNGIGAAGNYLSEGKFRVATTTANNVSGLWSVSIPKTDIGRGLVATATNTGSGSGVNKRTSEFSNPICFNTPCMPPKTVTLTTLPTPPTALCTGTSLDFTGGYTLPSTGCVNPYYYSWYKDGALLSGPTSLVSPAVPTRSISSLVLTDAGTYTLKVTDSVKIPTTITPANACAKTASVVVTVVTCPPLPVEWLSFYGVNSGESNKLFWSTAKEANNDRFEIERSIDGNTFELLDIVSSNGSSGSLYKYDDGNIKKGTTYYYRIKQIDIDKNYSYSKNISIATSGTLAVNLYPNPAGNSATVAITSAENSHYTYKVVDLLGKTHTIGNMDASSGISETQLDFSNLQNGMYVLIINDELFNSALIKIEIQK